MTFFAQIFTLYPEMFPGPLGVSLAGRALEQGTWSCDPIQIRDFASDKHRTVDDTPAGGGAGMVLRCDVLSAAVDHASALRPESPILAMTPRGAPITQSRIRDIPASRSSAAGSRGSTSACSRPPADRAGQPHRHHPLRRRDGRADASSMLAFGCFPA
jgi:hypothetical protein